MVDITLRPIDEFNFIDCFNLQLGDGQDKFVSHPIRSLAQAYVYRDQCQPFGVYAGDTMAGYVMVIYDYDEETYNIWHMMIDASKQGEGYGSTALKQVMEYIFYRPHINRCLARKYSEKVPNKFGEKYGTDKIAILSC